MLDLNTIFSHYNPNRFFTVYGILGVGYIRGFKNDEAHTNKYTYVHPNEMTLIWENNKLNAVSGRGGLQFDFRLAKRVSFNLEVSPQLLPISSTRRMVITPIGSLLPTLA